MTKITCLAVNGLALTMLLGGCASTPPLVLDQVGPRKEFASEENNEGCLVVYTAFRPLMNVVDPDTSLHSDYTLLSNDGTTRRYVQNWVSKVSSDPASVSLLAGQYTVEADSESQGKVKVPVLIEAHRTTTLFLDGSSSADLKKVAKSQLVVMPDGSVVGWRGQ